MKDKRNARMEIFVTHETKSAFIALARADERTPSFIICRILEDHLRGRQEESLPSATHLRQVKIAPFVGRLS